MHVKIGHWDFYEYPNIIGIGFKRLFAGVIDMIWRGELHVKLVAMAI